MDYDRRLSTRVNAVSFSGIRAVAEQAAALEREGAKVIHLELGRPDYITPAHIIEAAKAALDSGLVHYTSNYGLAALRQAVADKLQRENGISADPEKEILITVGAAEAINLSYMAILNPGDEVIIPTPHYLHHEQIARLAGATPVFVPLSEGDGWTLDLSALARAVTTKTRMILLNSPHNPTGAVLPRGQIEAVADLARRRDLLIASDEVYEKFVYGGATHVSIAGLPGMWERTITINAFSKTYSMTGWRLGYVCAPAPLIRAMVKLHQYTVTCATSFAQAGAVAALRGSQDCVAEMATEYDRRRKLMVEGLSSTPGIHCAVPMGAFYVFPRIGDGRGDDVNFAAEILRETHVAVVPGSTFGASGAGHIRMSFASSYESLAEALSRMGPVLERLARG